jgi:hypothetical protein
LKRVVNIQANDAPFAASLKPPGRVQARNPTGSLTAASATTVDSSGGDGGGAGQLSSDTSQARPRESLVTVLVRLGQWNHLFDQTLEEVEVYVPGGVDAGVDGPAPASGVGVGWRWALRGDVLDCAATRTPMGMLLGHQPGLWLRKLGLRACISLLDLAFDHVEFVLDGLIVFPGKGTVQPGGFEGHQCPQRPLWGDRDGLGLVPCGVGLCARPNLGQCRADRVAVGVGLTNRRGSTVCAAPYSVGLSTDEPPPTTVEPATMGLPSLWLTATFRPDGSQTVPLQLAASAGVESPNQTPNPTRKSIRLLHEGTH